MNTLNLEGVDYLGADIVDGLIQDNMEQYVRKNVKFQYLDLIHDELPKVDLIFCRDCLVHFPFKDIFLALHNICSSGSGYLLTTTFPSRQGNGDRLTGQWRPLNLEIPPFDFPEPRRIIHEACTEGEGAYHDKSLGLWRIEDIKKSLTKRGAWRLFRCAGYAAKFVNVLAVAVLRHLMDLVDTGVGSATFNAAITLEAKFWRLSSSSEPGESYCRVDLIHSAWSNTSGCVRWPGAGRYTPAAEPGHCQAGQGNAAAGLHHGPTGQGNEDTENEKKPTKPPKYYNIRRPAAFESHMSVSAPF